MAKRLSMLSMLTAIGLLAAWLEYVLLPPIAVPGVKLGLANLATVAALFVYGFRGASAVTFARVALAALLFGNLSTLMFALAGALLAVPGMALLKRVGGFSPVGVSIAGGVLHNAGQLLAAAVIAKTPGLAAYLPVLLVSGAAMGAVNGVIALAVIRRFR